MNTKLTNTSVPTVSCATLILKYNNTHIPNIDHINLKHTQHCNLGLKDLLR